mmetsp:Transcript_49615/g.55401  ORF Transcript_49615/g.55401 Transcript_49615/m.55401 type:complete len:192 (-) Transcript_49615:147-722(-)|eukprot:CAMPEP_0170788610 /NCGR_PEP_ID=MMETSP0733-20121128/19072_1 /TAXON_ID=186038 /ORGANISM="Fragilariopsis kerguelensis, Strain L26-C5" /LENGTH=191 /DNA_ID=CAMNT_0011135223 /DNA_START=158 /DNA_END=733 /DNA_ORIENTATION=+
MKVTRNSVILLVAILPSLTVAFGVQPRNIRQNQQKFCSKPLMAKGFDNAADKNKEKPVKSDGQKERERASGKYDEIAKSGGQEYSIFVRQFGSSDDSWLPCGSIAVGRGDQVSNAIFGNEGALKKAIIRTMPKLKGFETEFEYGYNLKIYPDEPVTVATKRSGGDGPSIGNWMSNLLSPIDTSNIPPPPSA